MVRNATTPAEVIAFLGAVQPSRVHLLGRGPRSADFADLLAAIRRTVPGIEVSCDSARIVALVGKTNGARGGPRPITRRRGALARSGTSAARLAKLKDDIATAALLDEAAGSASKLGERLDVAAGLATQRRLPFNA